MHSSYKFKFSAQDGSLQVFHKLHLGVLVLHGVGDAAGQKAQLVDVEVQISPGVQGRFRAPDLHVGIQPLHLRPDGFPQTPSPQGGAQEDAAQEVFLFFRILKDDHRSGKLAINQNAEAVRAGFQAVAPEEAPVVIARRPIRHIAEEHGVLVKGLLHDGGAGGNVRLREFAKCNHRSFSPAELRSRRLLSSFFASFAGDVYIHGITGGFEAGDDILLRGLQAVQTHIVHQRPVGVCLLRN